MKNFVVTEMSLPIKLQSFGILHHLAADDVQFHIPSWIYNETSKDLSRPDATLVRSMVSQGKLKLLSLTGGQVAHMYNLKNGCCSMFLARTVAAVVLAKSLGYTLVSEDQVLRVIAWQQLGVSLSPYGSAAAGLMQDIVSRGISLEIELFHELI